MFSKRIYILLILLCFNKIRNTLAEMCSDCSCIQITVIAERYGDITEIERLNLVHNEVSYV